MRPAQIAHRLVTEFVAWSGVGISPQHGLRILMYHSVGGRADNDRYGYYSISAENFTRHMDVLAQSQGIAVTAISLSACSSQNANVAITFDDGYRDNLKVAAPILLERRLPFTVYVAPQFVRDRHPEFLSPEDVHELACLPGVTIGAHGNTHTPLAICDDNFLAMELAESKAYLEDLTGREVVTMSYPHGSVNSRVRDAVEAAGYKFATCSHAGVNYPGCDPLLLSRTTIFAQDDEFFFRRKLTGCWDWYGYLQKRPFDL